MSHTPTPWQKNGYKRVEPVNAPRYELNDGWIVADCEGPDAEANAAHIVRCVNAHEGLVAALEDIMVFCVDMSEYQDSKWAVAGRAALRAAKEG